MSVPHYKADDVLTTKHAFINPTGRLMSPAISYQSNVPVYVKLPYPAALDHHSVEQREAAARSEQMAPHARPPHRDRRQEEGQEQCHSQLTPKPCSDV